MIEGNCYCQTAQCAAARLELLDALGEVDWIIDAREFDLKLFAPERAYRDRLGEFYSDASTRYTQPKRQYLGDCAHRT